MTLALAAGDTISGIAGSATSITYTISGDEITSSGDAFKVLAQGQLASSAGTLYTVPASTSAVVKSIHLANPTASAVTAKLTVKGTAAANVILPAISIVAGGFAVFGSDGWVFYNSSGQRMGEGATGPQGDAGAAGADGADGVGIPIGGTTGQRLAKASNTDYDTEWVSPGTAAIDVQEGGASVVAAASAINFDASDFNVTDEGSGVAGVALASPGGGSGGGTSFSLDDPTYYPLDVTYGDDFDGTSLNARWTRLNIDADTEEFAVGGSWLRQIRNITVPSGGEGYYQTPVSFPTYMEIIWAGSFESDISTGGSPQAGPFMVTSAGAGIGAAINPQGNYFRVATLSSGAPSGGNTLTRQSVQGVIGGGHKHWVRLIRVVGVRTMYFGQFSTDGNTWSPLVSVNDTTAVTRIGFGRLVGLTTAWDTLSTDRFNAVTKTLGNNLCVTPTSGTFTPTASSTFSGFSAASAFDGNIATDWASNGYANGQYIQGVWSVAQTLNTIVLTGRTSDTWAGGYVEFSSGRRIMLPFMGSTINNCVVLRFSNESTTLIKVVSTSGGGTNPGFREIEAYNAS